MTILQDICPKTTADDVENSLGNSQISYSDPVVLLGEFGRGAKKQKLAQNIINFVLNNYKHVHIEVENTPFDEIEGSLKVVTLSVADCIGNDLQWLKRFPNLISLEIHDEKNIKGIDWSCLNQLKALAISTKNLDRFFFDECGLQLEELILHLHDGFEGCLPQGQNLLKRIVLSSGVISRLNDQYHFSNTLNYVALKKVQMVKKHRQQLHECERMLCIALTALEDLENIDFVSKMRVLNTCILHFLPNLRSLAPLSSCSHLEAMHVMSLKGLKTFEIPLTVNRFNWLDRPIPPLLKKVLAGRNTAWTPLEKFRNPSASKFFGRFHTKKMWGNLFSDGREFSTIEV